VADNFQTENNNIKPLMKYKGVTQKVLLLLESILHMLNNFNMLASHGT
jgi:hypothetical protein